MDLKDIDGDSPEGMAINQEEDTREALLRSMNVWRRYLSRICLKDYLIKTVKVSIFA